MEYRFPRETSSGRSSANAGTFRTSSASKVDTSTLDLDSKAAEDRRDDHDDAQDWILCDDGKSHCNQHSQVTTKDTMHAGDEVKRDLEIEASECSSAEASDPRDSGSTISEFEDLGDGSAISAAKINTITSPERSGPDSAELIPRRTGPQAAGVKTSLERSFMASISQQQSEIRSAMQALQSNHRELVEYLETHGTQFRQQFVRHQEYLVEAEGELEKERLALDKERADFKLQSESLRHDMERHMEDRYDAVHESIASDAATAIVQIQDDMENRLAMFKIHLEDQLEQAKNSPRDKAETQSTEWKHALGTEWKHALGTEWKHALGTEWKHALGTEWKHALDTERQAREQAQTRLLDDLAEQRDEDKSDLQSLWNQGRSSVEFYMVDKQKDISADLSAEIRQVDPQNFVAHESLKAEILRKLSETDAEVEIAFKEMLRVDRALHVESQRRIKDTQDLERRLNEAKEWISTEKLSASARLQELEHQISVVQEQNASLKDGLQKLQDREQQKDEWTTSANTFEQSRGAFRLSRLPSTASRSILTTRFARQTRNGQSSTPPRSLMDMYPSVSVSATNRHQGDWQHAFNPQTDSFFARAMTIAAFVMALAIM